MLSLLPLTDIEVKSFSDGRVYICFPLDTALTESLMSYAESNYRSLRALRGKIRMVEKTIILKSGKYGV